MADLPTWVYDVVMALERWSDNHPRLHAEFYDTDAGKHVMRRVDECGCEGLQLVPADVRAHARVLSDYLEAARCTRPDVDVSTLGETPGSRTRKGRDPDCSVHREGA